MSNISNLARGIDLASLVRTHAWSRPDEIAIRFEGRDVSWAALDRRVSEVAGWLKKQGVAAGDRVAILMFNRVDFVEVLLAATRMGAIAVPLNFRLTGKELQYILDDCGPNYVFADDCTIDQLRQTDYDPARTVLSNGDEAANAGEFIPYERVTSDAAAGEPDSEKAAEDVAWIVYTSGTTGRPKGAMLTHLNLLMQGYGGIVDHKLEVGDTIMVATPLFHIAGIGVMLPCFILGLKSVVEPTGGFDAAALAERLEAEQISYLFLVPSQWQLLVNEPSAKSRDYKLKAISWGAAPASISLLRAMGEMFPEARNTAVFGQTEMSPVTCSLRADMAVEKMGSVGKPLPTVQARIVDVSGNDVKRGEVGEIVYRGPTTMKGYWNKEAETAEAFRGGWFHSGDLVYEDEDGYIYVVDRAKDMIISGGENIFSAEVENVINDHPDVLASAVVGRASERWGEEPIVYIEPVEGKAAPSLQELHAWLKDKLSKYKWPHEVIAMQPLPRNPSGKILKHVLRKK